MGELEKLNEEKANSEKEVKIAIHCLEQMKRNGNLTSDLIPAAESNLDAAYRRLIRAIGKLTNAENKS